MPLLNSSLVASEKVSSSSFFSKLYSVISCYPDIIQVKVSSISIQIYGNLVIHQAVYLTPSSYLQHNLKLCCNPFQLWNHMIWAFSDLYNLVFLLVSHRRQLRIWILKFRLTLLWFLRLFSPWPWHLLSADKSYPEHLHQTKVNEGTILSPD